MRQTKKLKKSKYAEKQERKDPSASTFQSQIKLSNEQITAQQTILDNDIAIVIGHAGSGKSLLACHTAIKLYDKGEIDKIIITRPTVSTEDIGTLPGGLDEKYTPYVMPLISNLSKLYDPRKIKYMLDKKDIQMLPLQFIRGLTFEDAVTIIDEAQNLTMPQLKMILSRIGTNSRIILCGDTDQIDLKRVNESGLYRLSQAQINGMCTITLTEEHRKPIVIDILNYFKDQGF